MAAFRSAWIIREKRRSRCSRRSRSIGCGRGCKTTLPRWATRSCGSVAASSCGTAPRSLRPWASRVGYSPPRIVLMVVPWADCHVVVSVVVALAAARGRLTATTLLTTFVLILTAGSAGRTALAARAG